MDFLDIISIFFYWELVNSNVCKSRNASKGHRCPQSFHLCHKILKVCEISTKIDIRHSAWQSLRLFYNVEIQYSASTAFSATLKKANVELEC